MQRNGVVLIVEDDYITRKVLRIYFNKNNIRTIEAVDGIQALELWYKQSPTVILLDIRLPRLNGFQVAEEIRKIELPRGYRTPIIAITAYAMNSDREKCFALGMDDYMAKPFTPAKILKLVKPYLSEGMKYNFQEERANRYSLIDNFLTDSE